MAFDYREFPQLKTYLKNGAVIWSESKPAPYLSICLTFRTDADQSQNYGYRHLIEHLVSRKNPNLDREIEAAGGTTTASTGRDWLQFQWNIPKGSEDLGWKAVRSTFEISDFSSKEVEREINAIGYELRLKTNLEIDSVRAWTAIYGLDGLDPAGSVDSLKKAQVNELNRMWRDIAVAERAVITVSGPLEPKETNEKIRPWLTAIRGGKPRVPKLRVKSGDFRLQNQQAFQTAPVGTTSWAGTLSASFVAAAVTPESYLIHTVSPVEGVVLVGSRRESEALSKNLREYSIQEKFNLGKRTAAGWIAIQTTSAAQSAQFHGQLLSCNQNLTLAKLYEAIELASPVTFQQTLEALEAKQ